MNFIGHHECSKTTQSLFNEDGTMRSAGTKACLIKTLKEETKVVSVPDLSREQRQTVVVMDATYVVRRWSFHNDETFGAIARLYKNNLIKDVPAGTSILHFCCDWYSSQGCSRSVSSIELLTHRSFSFVSTN